jgi:peptidoglycan hydrolase FlgJ
VLLYVNPLSTARATSMVAAEGQAGRDKVAFEELEHHFIFTMLQEMRKSIPEGGIFPRGHEERMYEEMLDDAMSGEIAHSGQFGIAKMIAEQLRIEEMQKHLKGSEKLVDPGAAGKSAGNAGDTGSDS